MNNRLDPFRAAFDISLDTLILTLKEAQDYLAGNNDLAAIGSLCSFEDQVADLNAARRLYLSAKRRES